ncbi:MAG: hypothetical protein KAR11_03250 [Phycisphaerae bacterium]|nr:hypothetical protein [Phycisphaerae bacterium]
MKKSITMLSVVILMVGFASLLFAGCDDRSHHGRRRMRTKRDVVVVRYEKDNHNRRWEKDEWKHEKRHHKWERKRHEKRRDGKRSDRKSRDSKKRRRR